MARELEHTYPIINRDLHISLYTTTLGHPSRRSQRITVAIALMATTVLIVLFASLNVTSLILARMRTRLKEIGVRVALGASRGRILRQLLFETVLLFLCGGVLSLLLAAWTGSLLTRIQLPTLGPEHFDFSIDSRVLLFTFFLAVLPGLLFGLAPALLATRLDTVKVLQAGIATTSPAGRSFSLRKVLLASQLAISLVLLIGAVLFTRSLENTERLNPGFTNLNTLMCSLSLGSLGYDEPPRGGPRRRRVLFHRQLQGCPWAPFLPRPLRRQEPLAEADQHRPRPAPLAIDPVGP